MKTTPRIYEFRDFVFNESLDEIVTPLLRLAGLKRKIQHQLYTAFAKFVEEGGWDYTREDGGAFEWGIRSINGDDKKSNKKNFWGDELPVDIRIKAEDVRTAIAEYLDLELVEDGKDKERMLGCLAAWRQAIDDAIAKVTALDIEERIK